METAAAMTSASRLFDVLRTEIKGAGLTYRELARRIGISESSVKRIFSEQDMPLSRLVEICAAVGIAFDDLLTRAAMPSRELSRLSLEQERALVADPKLLLVAICCLSQWTFEQIIETYTLTAAEAVARLARLDRLGLIELRPDNRYRLVVGRSFHWRRRGPISDFLRQRVLDEFFDATFEGRGEVLVTMHGQLSPDSSEDIAQRIEQLGGAFTQRQHDDQRRSTPNRCGFTLVVGLRSFELSTFTAIRRSGDQRSSPDGSSTEPRKR